MDPSSQPGWLTAARIFLQVLIPVILVLTSVRMLMTNTFVRFNYSLPGFPGDRYGFTEADRLFHAPIALEYLSNAEGIEFLGNQQFDDGSPVYNASELGHMEDVKEVTRSALNVWRLGLIAAVVVSVVLWRVAGSQSLWEAWQGGAKLTVIIMLVLLVGLIAAFSVLFVGFHEIFFDPNTWTFSFSDTLIRLFPQRFWEVAFGTIAVATLLQAGLLYLVSRLLLSRSG
ncbi:MAG: TIGR01906 family membrane protein [Anaerolineales bacterium]